MKLNDYFIVDTGLTDETSYQVLLNVIGQLSDGMWENSRVMEHYWRFVEVEKVNGKVCILVNKDHFSGRFDNYFATRLDFDPVKIKKFFADKIRAIVRENAKDEPNAGIVWKPDCMTELDYITPYSANGDPITAGDAYRVAKSLI